MHVCAVKHTVKSIYLLWVGVMIFTLSLFHIFGLIRHYFAEFVTCSGAIFVLPKKVAELTEV